MSTFILLAALLTAAVAAAVVLPLVRKGKDDNKAPMAAAVVIVVLAVGGTVFYVSLSNWSWHAPQPAATPETMVAQLARRLERTPDDLEGWLKLGRSYVVLQQYSLAARAYQRADRLAEGRNVEALTGLAEALALGDESELEGRAGRLLEQALQVDPHSPKALYYGALAAMRRGDLAVARDRFAGMLALDPPDTIRPLLEKQIAALDSQIATGVQPQDNVAHADTAPQSPAAGGARVVANVTLGPTLQGKIENSAPLFIIVREPGVRGPPLAVKRLTSHFPQSVELTPADSMINGRSFQEGQVVEVLARIARSGNPVGATGDPFGSVTTRVGQNRALELVIDRITP